MRALVIGHFSTFGDIEVLRVVEHKLSDAAIEYDVAPFSKSIARGDESWLRLKEVDASSYTHLLIVCGPFWRETFIKYRFDLDRFAHCVRIGVNLSMIEDLDAYNPFDTLLGRDSSEWAMPDVSFLHGSAPRRVAGLCYVKEQNEYGDRQRHGEAVQRLRALAERHNLAIVEMDTEWPSFRNRNGLNTPNDFESLCAKLDVMLTTRLHGTVLSLKQGLPVIALDAIVGGGKVTRQCGAVGWEECFQIATVADDELDAALQRCLQPEARSRAQAATERARQILASFDADFSAALAGPPQAKPARTGPDFWPTPSQRLKRQLRKRWDKYIGRRFR
ncbi:MAG: polysaccharide pyruvyl transferase family protein [Neomegalonema sp.]|nr:polysaccharide pyruvyl transferase family protein [Neomegalonema sp.]